MEAKKNQVERIIIELSGSEILERNASSFGTGAHVIIPKEHAGKVVKIIIGGKKNVTEKK
jgi:putative transposon-encoded protein